MEVEEQQATATAPSGEQLEIRKTGDFERALRLIKNEVNRREADQRRIIRHDV